jgi:CubicO group peptidase (beta-lactamase class C family)
MKNLVRALILFAPLSVHAQDPYFPPIVGNTWETVDPDSLGWCTDAMPALLEFLEDNNTKAFIVLKDGRIAIEEYFGTFTQDSIWYWASAGKSLTAFLVGKAQQDGLLDIEQPSSTYLGSGWTSCTPDQEAAITVRHQLNMTTGLDDGLGDADCTDPECLEYLAPPGARWAYHNAPYTRLDGVISNATGQSLNTYLLNELTATTGLSGLFLQVGYNNVMFSTARSMARFGLLAMNRGTWNGNAILSDQDYFDEMVNPSQPINRSYGYLWWLNGQSSYMLPGLQLEIPGPIMPNAPAEAFNAMGKNGQFINVVPSQGLVLVRMGNIPGSNLFVPNFFNDDIWEYLNDVLCATIAVEEQVPDPGITLSPNPATHHLRITLPTGATLGELHIVDATGRVVRTEKLLSTAHTLDLGGLAPGYYHCVLSTADRRVVKSFVLE